MTVLFDQFAAHRFQGAVFQHSPGGDEHDRQAQFDQVFLVHDDMNYGLF